MAPALVGAWALVEEVKLMVAEALEEVEDWVGEGSGDIILLLLPLRRKKQKCFLRKQGY
jgi:hypothetical protein